MADQAPVPTPPVKAPVPAPPPPTAVVMKPIAKTTHPLLYLGVTIGVVITTGVIAELIKSAIASRIKGD